MLINQQKRIKKRENKINRNKCHLKHKNKKDNGNMNITNAINKENVKLVGIKDNDCL